VQRVPARHEQGLDNIHELGELHEKLEVHRAETLQGTIDLVESREQQRAEDWREGKMRRRWRDLFFGGHTDQMDDTFAKMFY